MTGVFTPSSRSADIAPITAAAPDMSHFMVSIPAPVLSDRPPESKTTPLPTSASALPRAPAGAYDSFKNRGVCVDPWPTPNTSAEPLLANLGDVEHLHGDAPTAKETTRVRRDLRRRRGLRGLVDEVACPHHRVGDHGTARQRGAHIGAAVTDDAHLRELRGLAVVLVLEELVCAEHHPFGHRLRSVGGGQIRRDARERGCDRRGLARAACERSPGATQTVERELVEIADADEHRRLRLELPGRRHREGVSQVGLEPGLLEERLEPTVERGVDDVGAGSEDPPVVALRDRHREQFGRDAVGGCRNG